MNLFDNVTDMTNFIIDTKVKKGDIVLDLTMGNGHDTLYLADKIGINGKVYSFDIQKEALLNTKKLLEENNIKNVELIQDNHKNILNYVNEYIDFAVYNLGYLPGGNKNVITKWDSTIYSLKSVLSILRIKGIVCICSYIGHSGGKKEYDEIIKFCKDLPKKEFNIIDIKHINRSENAPRMIIIEKIK